MDGEPASIDQARWSSRPPSRGSQTTRGCRSGQRLHCRQYHGLCTIPHVYRITFANYALHWPTSDSAREDVANLAHTVSKISLFVFGFWFFCLCFLVWLVFFFF